MVAEEVFRVVTCLSFLAAFVPSYFFLALFFLLPNIILFVLIIPQKCDLRRFVQSAFKERIRSEASDYRYAYIGVPTYL
jgi:hypothetical protein